jgi:hypothetical protein
LFKQGHLTSSEVHGLKQKKVQKLIYSCRCQLPLRGVFSHYGGRIKKTAMTTSAPPPTA